MIGISIASLVSFKKVAMLRVDSSSSITHGPAMIKKGPLSLMVRFPMLMGLNIVLSIRLPGVA